MIAVGTQPLKLAHPGTMSAVVCHVVMAEEIGSITGPPLRRWVGHRHPLLTPAVPYLTHAADAASASCQCASAWL